MTYGRGEHPKSRANLKPVKPGEVRNPGGRPPKEFCITDITREQLREPCPKDPTKTWAKYLSDKWLDLACDDIRAFRELMERLEGRVVFPVAMESEPVVHWQIGKGYVSEEEVKRLEGQSLLGQAESEE